MRGHGRMAVVCAGYNSSVHASRQPHMSTWLFTLWPKHAGSKRESKEPAVQCQLLKWQTAKSSRVKQSPGDRQQAQFAIPILANANCTGRRFSKAAVECLEEYSLQARFPDETMAIQVKGTMQWWPAGCGWGCCANAPCRRPFSLCSQSKRTWSGAVRSLRPGLPSPVGCLPECKGHAWRPPCWTRGSQGPGRVVCVCVHMCAT